MDTVPTTEGLEALLTLLRKYGVSHYSNDTFSVTFGKVFEEKVSAIAAARAADEQKPSPMLGLTPDQQVDMFGEVVEKP